MSLFGNLGNNAQQSSGTSLFGGASNNTNTQTSQPAQSTSLFGQSQPAQSSAPSLFGGASNTQQNQQQSTTPSLFGGASNTQQNQQQSTTPSLFGASTQQPATQGGAMSGNQQQNTGLFGNSTSAAQPANQRSCQWAAPNIDQNQQPQNSVFGNSMNNANSLSASLLSASMSALPPSLLNKPTSVGFTPQAIAPPRDKTIPEQMELLLRKWSPETSDCLMQHYFYVSVPPEKAPFITMPPNADEREWEQALRNKPTEGSVPVIAKGFQQLGTRLTMQVEAVKQLQLRLHEMNNSLSAMMQKHELVLSVRAAEAKRKHIGLSQRCLALAIRAQVLANRGFVLDGAEEELKKKLADLEKGVFDPAFAGREEEIWARMVAIRERTRWLQEESEKLGRQITGDSGLDEQVLAQTKKVGRRDFTTCRHRADANNRSLMITTHRLCICAKSWHRLRRSTKSGRPLANPRNEGRNKSPIYTMSRFQAPTETTATARRMPNRGFWLQTREAEAT